MTSSRTPGALGDSDQGSDEEDKGSDEDDQRSDEDEQRSDEDDKRSEEDDQDLRGPTSVLTRRTRAR